MGKTTLARQLAERVGRVTVHDLERPTGRAALEHTPEQTLGDSEGLVIIDEVQRMPSLFEILRPLCDDPDRRARFLLLGSASPDVLRGVSESLAGRAQFVAVNGFSLGEVGTAAQARFWTMLAHVHGQSWNAAELARSLSVRPGAANHYRDLLAGMFMLRAHPRYGASWESFALQQVLTRPADGRSAGWRWPAVNRLGPQRAVVPRPLSPWDWRIPIRRLVCWAASTDWSAEGGLATWPMRPGGR